MRVVIAVIPLDRLRESPEKTELIVQGKKRVGITDANMLDNGTHAVLSMEIPARPFKGRVILPKRIYQ